VTVSDLFTGGSGDQEVFGYFEKRESPELLALL
jgi:hypothetical protein